MRCYSCGKEMEITSAISQFIAEKTYQTTRTYKCRKCNKTFEVSDEPVKVKQ